ncbi:MAG: acyl-CoA reductase, partial [Bradymonadaceae bacterium]
AVLWHQSGCFSLRAVLFGGPDDRREAFVGQLAEAIEDWEQRLDARPTDPDIVARRTQAHNAAEFDGRAVGEGFGWVEPTDAPFRGDTPAPHVVTCHPVDDPADLDECLDLPPHHLQGVAVAEAGGADVWVDRLADLGATRICAPGDLQAPPGDWLHDGRPNVLDWLRVTSLD